MLYQSALGVVVISGAANNTPPPGQPYFNNVGLVNGGTAIYLGNQWVLSAAHVAGTVPATASFGGTSYATQADSFHRLHDPTTLLSPSPIFTDLVIFRLNSDPGISALAIASGTPTVGKEVMMIGAGRQQAASPTYWQQTFVPGNNNDIWTELTPPNSNINAAGYQTTNAPRVPKWGLNNVADSSETLNYGLGPVELFVTTFDSINGKPDEAQGVGGDSGGAVFAHDGAQWLLSGVMLVVGNYDNQPGGGNSALLGNETYSADLSKYRDEIFTYATIPEPSNAVFACISFAALCMRRRRSIKALSHRAPAAPL
ncbi:MAG: trypsin-like serine protease [Gloeobacteraceae cyanobacterium ES-bin-144]|nr:trypsin-like serine protease [Verrucomicrobiales bacterium]